MQFQNATRTVSKALVLAIALLPIAAGGFAQEVLFLADSGDPNDGMTKLLEVTLDPGTGRADLELLFEIPLEQVDALACTPDARKCYAIDKAARGGPAGDLGVYDLVAGTWQIIGPVMDVGGAVTGIVQAAFAPDGRLLAGSQDTDKLYEVDLATASATEIGRLQEQSTGAFLDLAGADFVFSAPGALHEAFLWTNAVVSGAPKGLYAIRLPDSVPGLVTAEFLGNGTDFFTGLSIREFGYGNVTGSTSQDDIHEKSPVDGADVMVYDMYLAGSPYDYTFGDMSSGRLATGPICRTPGFWGTHGGRRKGGHNITQAAIDAAGGQLEVCGQMIDRSEPIGGLESALEGLCVRVQGVKQRQLYRQLVAAALNCALSGAPDSCSNLVPGFDECNDLCRRGASGRAVSMCIESIDCFNNGGVFDPDSKECVYLEGNCHEQPLCDSPIAGMCFDPPGPATSSRECRQAKANDCTIDDC